MGKTYQQKDLLLFLIDWTLKNIIWERPQKLRIWVLVMRVHMDLKYQRIRAPKKDN